MSVSLEALAMAGIDSNDWAMNVQEWEKNEMEDDVPPHLLADEDDGENDDENVMSIASNYKFPGTRFFGSWRRKDGRAGGGGVHCISGILCSLKGAIEKRASNWLSSSVRIMVGTIEGFLMVMTMMIISAQRSKF